MNNAVISMRDVVKTYPGFRLTLPELNLSAGHLHVLIGTNGAGMGLYKHHLVLQEET